MSLVRFRLWAFLLPISLIIEYGALAQLVEHLTFNQVVRGSNPRCFTVKQFKFRYSVFELFFIVQKTVRMENALSAEYIFTQKIRSHNLEGG